ncbi:MAG: DUF1570 domain-containing protein [Candidatus Acidiferrum sp.]
MHFTVYTPASEHEARKIADQFEQIRVLFHAAFPMLRIDPGQPVVILAVKNEKGMKEFLPEQWEQKGHMHAAGLYQQGFDKHYVLLQLDSEGNNPYHTLYHEYTHALMHLNFSNIPVWLDEGIAEYLGNASIGDKESSIGNIDPGNLYVLQQNRLLPLATLLAVDHSSPYYNESNRVSVFYAESWALTHYLVLSPEARQKQLLSHFLAAWNSTHDQIEAARQTFGDLKKFELVLYAYVRSGNFYHGIVKNSGETVDKSSAPRSISPAELEVLRGDFFVHHNRLEAGRPLLDHAAKLEPNLAFAHEALAGFYYRQQDLPAMTREAQEAMRLGDKSFIASYLEAIGLLQTGNVYGNSAESRAALEQAGALLEQSAKLNPNFAPTYEALANFYATNPEKQNAAVNTMMQAVKLDPAELHYSVHLTELLLAANRQSDAKIMADRIAATAQTPFEKLMAERAQKEVAEHPHGGVVVIESAEPDTVVLKRRPVPNPAAAEAQNNVLTEAQQRALGVEGVLTDVDCAKSPTVTLDLILDGGEASYHIADIGKVTLAGAANHSAPECPQWNGRRAMVWFVPSESAKNRPAEITKIVFE